MKLPLGKRIGFGAVSDVYEYGEDKVCKLYKDNVGDVEYEYRKTLDAYNNGLLAPKVYEIVEHNGRHGIIMERINGTSYMTILLSHITECHKNGMSNVEIFHSPVTIGLIHSTANILFSLHQKKCNIIETGTDSLKNSCKHNRYLTDIEKEAVNLLIDKLPAGDSVCHGDPNPGNFITHNDKVFIIDWTNCVKANPLYDLTEYVLLMKYSDVSIELPEFIMEFLRECKEEFGKVFLDYYVSLSGIDLSNMNMWIIPLLVSKMGGNNSTQKQNALLVDIRKRLHTL